MTESVPVLSRRRRTLVVGLFLAGLLALLMLTSCAADPAPKVGQATPQGAVQSYLAGVAIGDPEQASKVSVPQLEAADLRQLRRMLFSDEATFAVSAVLCADEGDTVETPGGQRLVLPVESVVAVDGSIRLGSEDTLPAFASVVKQPDGTWLVEGFSEQQ